MKNRFIWAIVITKNDSRKLMKFLESYFSVGSHSKVELTVIDDSSIESEIKKNALTIASLWEITHIDHIHKNNMYDYFDRKDISHMFWLGITWWNTGNVRSLSSVYKKNHWAHKHRVFHFDDDVLFSWSYNPNEFLLLGGKYNFIVSDFTWCPDLSHLERIFLFVLVSSQNWMNDIRDQHLPSFIKTLGKENIISLFKKYIEDFDGCIHNESNTGEIKSDINFPNRDWPWWLCYLSENKVEYTFPLLNYYDEDRRFFWVCKNELWASTSFISAWISHNVSEKKNLFSIKNNIEIEYGKILTELICDYWIKIKDMSFLEETISNIILKRKNNVEKIFSRSIKIHNWNAFVKKSIDLLITIKDWYQNDEDMHATVLWLYLEYQKSFIDNEFQVANVYKDKINRHSNVIVFSPHIDDACLSVCWFMKDKTIHSTIINVFSKSNYTIDWFGDLNQVTLQRKEENENVYKEWCYTNVYWDYLDACCSSQIEREQFMSYSLDVTKLPKYKVVRERILSSELGQKILLFPLWIWWHIDHRILFSIWNEVADRGYEVYFYLDVWYDDSCDASFIDKHICKYWKNYIATVFPITEEDFSKKRNLLKLYKTQYDDELDDSFVSQHATFKWEILFQKI